MYNITKGNTIPMKAILEHEEERFPVAVSTNISVRAYNEYRYIDAENVTVDQEEDGVLYFEIPPTLNTGIFGVEVKGNVNGVSWRTATDGVVKITGATQRNDGSEAVPEGDTYDIVMRVQLYKNQSSDRAIEEHNSDEASHPYILGELERIEGEIPTLPEHIVTDENYVHTDNNYTDTDKSKLNSALQQETDPTVPQWAKQPSKPSYTPQEVGALPNTTKYGSTIDLSMNSTTYVLTLSLKDQDGTVLNTKTVDMPIESVVVNGRYDAVNKKIVLTLQSGNTIDVPVGDLIAGLQTEITSVNMLDADLVDDTNSTHKFVTAQEKTTWNKKSDFSGSYNDLTDKPAIPVVPSNVSAFNNDAGYITKTVNDLVNYYLKADVYTKTEVANLIAAIQQFHYEIYASISAVTSPAGNVLYLIGPTGTGSDKYEEYVYADSQFVKIGDTSIDLSGYYTSQQTDSAITQALNTALANYTTTAALTLLLAGKQDVINDLSDIRSGAAAGATAYQKPQGGIPSTDLALGMDNVPTSGSDNFVKSGGVYSALQGKQDTLVSGTNIKTINNQSILGEGNITIQGGGSSVQSDWNQTDTEADDYIKNKPTIPAEQVQSDWNQTNNSSKDFIKNKPTIPTVPTNVSAFTNDAGYLTQHQDISGKADKSEMSVADGTGADSDKTTITLKTDTSATVLKSHQSLSGKQDVIDSSHKLSADLVDDTNTTNKFTNAMEKQAWNAKQDALTFNTAPSSSNKVATMADVSVVTGKADKVTGATSGNFAALDSNGNLTDSGHKHSDYLTSHQDISGKEDVTTIVAPVNATDATLPITTLATEIGKYYRIDVAVETLAVTLPAMTDLTTVRTVVLYLTGGTTPAITIATADNKDVYYQDGYAIESGKTYEVNCLWNGAAWIVASVEIILT